MANASINDRMIQAMLNLHFKNYFVIALFTVLTIFSQSAEAANSQSVSNLDYMKNRVSYRFEIFKSKENEFTLMREANISKESQVACMYSALEAFKQANKDPEFHQYLASQDLLSDVKVELIDATGNDALSKRLDSIHAQSEELVPGITIDAALDAKGNCVYYSDQKLKEQLKERHATMEKLAEKMILLMALAAEQKFHGESIYPEPLPPAVASRTTLGKNSHSYESDLSTVKTRTDLPDMPTIQQIMHPAK